jgi:hypothetical protein
MIAVLMTNQLPETGRYERPDKFHVLQAEKDVKLAIDSGYEPDAFGSLGNIVITADLQRFIAEQKLVAATKESEESHSVKLREEREEKREQSAQAAIEEISDAEKHEKYLKETHALGDIELTGRQWKHVSTYAEKNRERLTAEWLEDGMDKQDVEDTFKVMEIMGRGPANEQEKTFVQERIQNPDIKSRTETVIGEAGFDVEKARGQAPSLTQSGISKPAYDPMP